MCVSKIVVRRKLMLFVAHIIHMTSRLYYATLQLNNRCHAVSLLERPDGRTTFKANDIWPLSTVIHDRLSHLRPFLDATGALTATVSASLSSGEVEPRKVRSGEKWMGEALFGTVFCRVEWAQESWYIFAC